MFDKISKVQESVIQHGPLNNRIYLMKLAGNDIPQIIKSLNKLCEEKKYSKIIAKVPKERLPVFEDNGYILEASIPGFFNGTGDVAFISKYFTKERYREHKVDRIKEILSIAKEKYNQADALMDVHPLRIGMSDWTDTEEMALVYKKVFQSYPFPIHDQNYLLKTMRNNVRYFYVRDGNRIIALSSSEMELDWQNVEMTDFATLQAYRSRGLAVKLLETMETVMKRRGMRTAYTIARALSVGMNITFAKMGYTYAGTLTNNTNISGNIESMNVWYKNL